MSQKEKVQSEAPRYNLNLQSSKKEKNKKQKKQKEKRKKQNLPLSSSLCTPLFCDKLPKSNQDSSSKEGGGGDRRKLANSARKA